MVKLSNSKGDTIVEVLIALTVLSTILVGAYVTANKSQNASQASQERGEAIKEAETQIERLKGLFASGTSPTSLPSMFCVKDDSSTDSITSAPGALKAFDVSLNSDTFPYTTECQKNGRYNVAIKSTSSNNYEFLVRWDRIGGGRDQINMYYRVHQ